MLDDSPQRMPTVVFVDDERWESFIELAAILRKAGVRTVHISVGSSKWCPERLLFDRNVSLPSPPNPEQLATLLSNEYVTDVQPTESLATTTYAALSLLPASQRSDIWVGRSVFLDKWDVAQVLRDLGLRAPDTLLADATSPAEAIEKFSLPIVLKRRVSSSGAGVKIFDTLETLLAFVAQIESPNEWFFERYIQGRSFVCAGCVGDDGIDLMATYETLKRIKKFGSSMVVEFHNDLEIAETGKSLINSMGTRGFVCFDIIRDMNDIDWIHDVNPRVFGCFSTCQLFGFDFCNAYLDCLLGHGKTTPSQFEFEETKDFVFPFALKEVFQSGQSGPSLLRALQWTWMYWRLLCSRYFVSLAIRAVVYSYEWTKERLGPLRSMSSNRKFNLLPPTK